jgi:hypothetical protein
MFDENEVFQTLVRAVVTTIAKTSKPEALASPDKLSRLGRGIEEDSSRAFEPRLRHYPSMSKPNATRPASSVCAFSGMGW